MIAFTRILFIVLFFSYPSHVIAQNYSISGKVVDKNNNPIEFANILVNDLNGKFVSGTSTNDFGVFELKNIKKTTYDLVIRFIGFEDFKQRIVLTGALDLKTIILKESTEELQEVKIIAKKPTVLRKPDRLIFNVENTALVESSTLGVLRSTPGVIVSEGRISVKNAPASVYINNRRVQLTPIELIQLLENSPGNSIKSVEVITNPPSSYDADSGSVINIVMSKNLVTGYRGSIFTNYTQGVFPRYNAGMSHYFKNNKINLNLSYSYSHRKINRDQDGRVNFLNTAGGIDEIWRSNVNRITRSQNHNINLNFDYFIDDKNTLSITGISLFTPYFKYNIANNTNIFNADDIFQSRFTADNLSRDDKYNIGSDIIFNHQINEKSGISVKGHYTTYEYQRNQNVFSNFFDADNSFINDSEFNTLANQSTEIINGGIDYTLDTNESSKLDVGVKYSNVITDSDIARIDIINGQEVLNTDNSDVFSYDEKVFSGYANFSKSWNQWDLNIGLRLEQTNIEGISESLNQINSQDYLNWFPNLSVSHNLSENASIVGNYKRSIERPDFRNLNPFTFFINENTVVLGNPDLLPSYTDSYSLTINLSNNIAISAYYDDYDGVIEELPRQDNQTNIIEFTPTNLDKKVDFGFDFDFNFRLSNSWDISGFTSFYKVTEEVDFGNEFIKLEQWSNYSNLTNSLTLLEDKSLNINFILGWSNRNLQRLQIVENRLISILNISKTVLNKKGIISLAVEDIFNYQDFDTSINYLNQSSRRFQDFDTRFIRLGFRYKFGNTQLSSNERSADTEERARIKDLN